MKSFSTPLTNFSALTNSRNKISKKPTHGDPCKNDKKIVNALHLSNGEVKRVTLHYCPETQEIREIPQEE